MPTNSPQVMMMTRLIAPTKNITPGDQFRRCASRACTVRLRATYVRWRTVLLAYLAQDLPFRAFWPPPGAGSDASRGRSFVCFVRAAAHARGKSHAARRNSIRAPSLTGKRHDTDPIQEETGSDPDATQGADRHPRLRRDDRRWHASWPRGTPGGRPRLRQDHFCAAIPGPWRRGLP